MGLAISEWMDRVPDFKDIKKIGLKLPDSTHLACAIGGDAKISVDDEILRKREKVEKGYEIKICSPKEFLKIEGE